MLMNTENETVFDYWHKYYNAIQLCGSIKRKFSYIAHILAHQNIQRIKDTHTSTAAPDTVTGVICVPVWHVQWHTLWHMPNYVLCNLCNVLKHKHNSECIRIRDWIPCQYNFSGHSFAYLQMSQNTNTHWLSDNCNMRSKHVISIYCLSVVSGPQCTTQYTKCETESNCCEWKKCVIFDDWFNVASPHCSSSYFYFVLHSVLLRLPWCGVIAGLNLKVEIRHTN